MSRLSRHVFVLLRPERLATALGTAALVVLLGLGLGVKGYRYALHRIAREIAAASEKLGVPIEVGQVSLRPFGATLTAVRVGEQSAVLVSRVTVSVGMNPFASDFLAPSEIEATRITLKTDTAFVRGLRAALARHASEADPASANGKGKMLERLFAALPATRLTLRGANVALIEEGGTPIAGARGLSALIDRASRKIIFKADRLTLRGDTETGVGGRLELEEGGGGYKFFVRRKGRGDANAAWSAGGRIARDLARIEVSFAAHAVPAPLRRYVAPILGSAPALDIEGKAVLEREVDAIRFDAHVRSRGVTIDVPLVSKSKIGPVPFELEASGAIRPDDRLIAVEGATFSLPSRVTGNYEDPPVRLEFSGMARHEDEGDTPGLALEGEVRMARAPCQAILDAAPEGLVPALNGFRLTGAASASFAFAYESSKPEALRAQLSALDFGCKVLSAPYAYTSEHLAAPFTLERQDEAGGPPRVMTLAPNAPSFTPLARLARVVHLAFVASEDAGFFTHRGIDAAAIEHALKRNVAEGRVAMGGSTITMQTVKNLFLTQDRTIARKLQELFLAWHVDTILSKERILELYMNIVEFGPGIYGITKAADHFFGKPPEDLTLLEAAYLASVLPSPKSRYRSFCEGKMTQGMSGVVASLMRRMAGLHHVTEDRYGVAMRETLHFNETTRQNADCPLTRETAESGEGGVP